MGFHLSPGPAQDLMGADVLLEALLDQIKALLADIAYAARARLLDRLEEHQVEAVIPPKSNQNRNHSLMILPSRQRSSFVQSYRLSAR